MTAGPRTASAAGLRLIGHHDLGGHGDGMQVIRHGGAVYVGHTGTTGAGTSVLDAGDPARPVLVTQWPAPPRSHTHKVQAAGGLLLVNHEKFPYRAPDTGPVSAGLAVYGLADPLRPARVAFWPSGGRGVHRVVWTGGRYAHMSAIPGHFRDRIWVVVDLADPAHPVEASRWWWPGQRDDETPSWPAGERYAAHHALIAGDRAYLGYDDAGLVVLDVTDMTRPRQAGHARWDGGSTHTCLPLPGRRLLVATDEKVRDGPHAPRRAINVLDISGETPVVLARCPHPDGFDHLPLRFGSHNLHENQPGAYRSERLVFATYFSAGVVLVQVVRAEPERQVVEAVRVRALRQRHRGAAGDVQDMDRPPGRVRPVADLLVGGDQQPSAGQRQAGVRRPAAPPRLPGLAGAGHVRHVQHDQPRVVVPEVGAVPRDQRVMGGVPLAGGPARRLVVPLAGPPPAARFGRVRGVGQVHHHPDAVAEVLGDGRHVRVPAAGPDDPVHPPPAARPEGHPGRPQRVGQPVDGQAGRHRPALRRTVRELLVVDQQQAAGGLHLVGVAARRGGPLGDQHRPRRVRGVEHRRPRPGGAGVPDVDGAAVPDHLHAIAVAAQAVVAGQPQARGARRARPSGHCAFPVTPHPRVTPRWPAGQSAGR